MRFQPVALLAAILLVSGCSSDGIYDPQKFFPAKDRHGWSDCNLKFGAPSTGIEVCASYVYPLNSSTASSYSISFHISNDEHVRLAVYDDHAILVRILLDQDEPANLPGSYRYPAIDWNFFDGYGHRLVPAGDYRIYFRAGGFISSSDVTVP